MDKFIDKLVDTRWFMKIVALILALLLFQSVYDPIKNVSNVNVPGEQDTEVLTDVPVKTYYDTENLIVTGVPDTVELTIKGPKNVLLQAKVQRNFEVYVDLSDAEIGTERVPIKIRDISDKLDVTIDPAYVNVSIQEKVTKEYKVDVEFDQSLIEDGYISEAPEAEPKRVKITGAKDVMERITYVKAAVNIKDPIRETVRREAQVLVLDKNMNKLDVIIDQQTVDVIIPVKSLSKVVPIKIVEKGSPPENISVESISLDVNEAKIYGSQEVLDKTENVRVEVDLSQINGNTEITLPVIISDDIKEVNPKTVKTTIKTSEKNSETSKNDEEADEHKMFSNLQIHLTGLASELEASLQAPANGASLTVTGKSDKVAELQASDFNVFLDLANLTVGDHEVKISVKGPADVDWKLATETAKISITQKEV
ncbi:YbbR-like domain-containing protein [Cytobacillus praedii]|uniref:YbbR-like domain-containing protein n=1 Tax=Cytobacillus praedii TaxID=1742358 RepID=A0A4R1AUN7_9BACI|nr:CdaR family protein [Cytobacillus praedii]MED3552954.1 CdaR family protein [Cytobacillus praedii]TCJ01422.1 YbbR-like domain-containing protein [Cytobacillus praedii]